MKAAFQKAVGKWIGPNQSQFAMNSKEKKHLFNLAQNGTTVSGFLLAGLVAYDVLPLLPALFVAIPTMYVGKMIATTGYKKKLYEFHKDEFGPLP